MAATLACLSRRLLSFRSLLSFHSLLPSARLCATTAVPGGDESDPDDPRPDSGPALSPSQPPRPTFQRPLEHGLDPGVYKAIMVGKVGQRPVQKHLRSGRAVVLFSLGTGGIRNNRRPLDNEEPREYAERCAVQWHRVCIYPGRLGDLALKHVVPGSILYLEGNLETKVFSDPISGLVRRIREIAIRRDELTRMVSWSWTLWCWCYISPLLPHVAATVRALFFLSSVHVSHRSSSHSPLLVHVYVDL